jgi:hypothetical protein
MARRRSIHEWEVLVKGLLRQRVQAYDRKGAIEAAIEQAPEHMCLMLRRCKKSEFITKDYGIKE